MAARGKLPKGFDSLPFKERKSAVENAPLGKKDRKIALLYYVEEIPQIEVAVAVGLERSAVSRRLPRIRAALESRCAPK